VPERTSCSASAQAMAGRDTDRARAGSGARQIACASARPAPDMGWELLPRFKERCIAMMSSVAEINSVADVPQAVAKYLTENKLPLSGACWPEFANLDWAGAGLEIEARPANGDDKVGITGTLLCGGGKRHTDAAVGPGQPCHHQPASGQPHRRRSGVAHRPRHGRRLGSFAQNTTACHAR